MRSWKELWTAQRQLRESRDEFERELKQEVVKRAELEEGIERMKKSVEGREPSKMGLGGSKKCDVRIDMVRKQRDQVERFLPSRCKRFWDISLSQWGDFIPGRRVQKADTWD